MQQRNEKVAEPSMEDILASIRKIISEDPSPTKAASGAAAPAATAVQATPQSSAAPSAASLATARPIMPPAPSPPQAAPSRLSDVMRELAPSAVPVGSAVYHDDLADLVDGDAEPAAASPPARMPASPAPVAAQPVNEPQPFMPAAAVPVVVPESAPQPRAAASRPADLGAFIPSTAEPIGMTSPRASALSIGADLRSFETAREAREPLMPRTLDIGLPLGQPLGQQHGLNREPAARSEPVPVALPSDPVSDPTETEGLGDPVAAAQSALGALAMGLASPTPNLAVVVPPSSPLVADAPAAVAMGERRSLDDAIVDMLRPMIKDWLDDNLPEMVGKALHQELNDRRGKDS